MKDKKITKKLLKKSGFKPIEDDSPEYNVYKLYGLTGFRLHIKEFYITIVNGMSNYEDRHWALHLDNDKFETIGSADLETIDQFNEFMDLMEVGFHL